MHQPEYDVFNFCQDVTESEDEMPKAYTRSGKPPYSYLGMIVTAIQNSPDKCLYTQEVQESLMSMFSFFRGSYKGWKSSVRHTICRYDCFIGTVCDKHRRQKRWTVDLAKVPANAFHRQETIVARNGSFAYLLHDQLNTPAIVLPQASYDLVRRWVHRSKFENPTPKPAATSNCLDETNLTKKPASYTLYLPPISTFTQPSGLSSDFTTDLPTSQMSFTPNQQDCFTSCVRQESIMNALQTLQSTAEPKLNSASCEYEGSRKCNTTHNVPLSTSTPKPKNIVVPLDSRTFSIERILGEEKDCTEGTREGPSDFMTIKDTVPEAQDFLPSTPKTSSKTQRQTFRKRKSSVDTASRKVQKHETTSDVYSDYYCYRAPDQSATAMSYHYQHPQYQNQLYNHNYPYQHQYSASHYQTVPYGYHQQYATNYYAQDSVNYMNYPQLYEQAYSYWRAQQEESVPYDLSCKNN